MPRWSGTGKPLPEGSVTSLKSLLDAQAGSAWLELVSSLGGGSVEMVLCALTEGFSDLGATLTFVMADPNQSLTALRLPPVPEAAGRLENLALDLMLQSTHDTANAALTARVVRDDIATELVSDVAVPSDVMTARTTAIDALIQVDGVLEAWFRGGGWCTGVGSHGRGCFVCRIWGCGGLAGLGRGCRCARGGSDAEADGADDTAGLSWSKRVRWPK